MWHWHAIVGLGLWQCKGEIDRVDIHKIAVCLLNDIFHCSRNLLGIASALWQCREGAIPKIAERLILLPW